MFRDDALGEIPIPASQIAQRLPANTPLKPPAAAVATPPPGLFGTGFLAGWNKSVALGFSGKSGNVDEFSLSASAEGDFSNDQKRWKFRAAYVYGLTESERTKDEGFTNLRRDWLRKDDPVFLFAEGRIEYNDFQAYRFRVGGFGGIGAAFVDAPETAAYRTSDRVQLLGRIGAGYSHEFGAVDDGIPEALAAVETRIKVTDGQTLRFSHTYFPSLDDFPESRNSTDASYTISIHRGRGLSLKVGFNNEYLSETEGDSTHNSLTYYGQLQYSF